MIRSLGDNVMALDSAELYPFPSAQSASLNWPSIALGLFCGYHYIRQKRCRMGKSRTVNMSIMEKIVDRLAQGETLVDITKDEKMPTYRAVTRAVSGDDELWELYRRGRILQAEFYADHINGLAMAPLPKGLDVRELNAEVNRRRLEIDTLKWTTARNQPFGIRDKKEDQPQSQAFTISWAGGDVAVNPIADEEQDSSSQATKH